MSRFVAPAGAPAGIPEIFRSLRSALIRNGRVSAGFQALSSRLQARHIFGVSSGRAALVLILKSLQRLSPDRHVVALPAYTCFSVAASVVQAGLKIYPVDTDAKTLDFDFAQLEILPQENLLCILTSNLFGLVHDGARIRSIARSKGALVVDDAAQALGATRDGRAAGMLGDVGFYSLGRGKALAAVEGGIIVTNAEAIASALNDQTKDLAKASLVLSTWFGIQMFAYSILIHPRLYWIPNSLPFLKLGLTEFDPSFRVSSLSEFSQALLSPQLKRLDELNQIRRQNAHTIAAALANNPHFAVLRVGEGCQPTYVRFPVIARDGATRDSAVKRLQAAGIGASAFYPSAICDIPGIKRHMALQDFHRPQAERLAQRLLTLPTHPLVRPVDLGRMSSILNGY
jgi:dTDP-4-amino-4,6-dideoxygalactose transaminase